MNRQLIRGVLFAASFLLSCLIASAKSVTVKVTNDGPETFIPRTAEVPANILQAILGSDGFRVADSTGHYLPCQLTFDNRLIFQPEIPAGSSALFTITAEDEPLPFPDVACGRIYPERADDIAWENEAVGFRIYGPATQAKGEKAFGYDIFLKHANPIPVLPALYESQTSEANWAHEKELKKVSPQLASEWANRITYHHDHGMGMDCYAVGPTMGDGMSAIVENDSILFAWCYQDATVLDNGPIRYTVLLDFGPRTIGKDKKVVEHRLISLDAGSHLNRTRVWFDNLKHPHDIAVGFPLRDKSPQITSPRHIAYADPTQGDNNGKAILGVVSAKPFASTQLLKDHVIGTFPLPKTDSGYTSQDEPFEYYWGFAWSREPLFGKPGYTPFHHADGTTDLNAWSDYLNMFAQTADSPLRVTFISKE